MGSPQDHKAAHPGAQRQGRKEPQARPGEVLQDPIVPLPAGPQGTGGEADEALQFDAQDDGWADVPEPSRVAKLRELADTTGEIECRKLIKCLASSDS